MKIYLVYCAFKKILFVFLLMSVCQIIVYQLPFQSKSELKLAEHKGNFETAKCHHPELHVLYFFCNFEVKVDRGTGILQSPAQYGVQFR